MNLAGLSVPVRFSCPETAKYFRDYCVPSQQENDAVFLSEEDWAWGEKSGFSRNAYAEYSLLTGTVSEAILEQGCCIAHAVAFRHGECAWLIAAPSGVGKSTQVRTLQVLYPGEFDVICGDRPVLRLLDEGGVMAYPSPWNGKENWYGAEAAPLEGIIYLQRGEENSLRMLNMKEAALPIYYSMIHNGSSVDKIGQVAAFEAELLKRVPVWLLSNRGVPASTKLLYEELFA